MFGGRSEIAIIITDYFKYSLNVNNLIDFSVKSIFFIWHNMGLEMQQQVLYIRAMKLEKISKALSDKNRLQILEFLSDGQRNVSEVADRLNVEENLASHHLRVLAALGFLKNDKKGREVFYMLNESRIVSLLKDMRRNPKFKSILAEALKD